MRDRILERLAADGVDLRRPGGASLSRRGFTQRQLVNEAEIVETLRPHGFEVVQPEQLTFAEQVQIVLRRRHHRRIGEFRPDQLHLLPAGRPGRGARPREPEFLLPRLHQLRRVQRGASPFVRGNTLQAEGRPPDARDLRGPAGDRCGGLWRGSGRSLRCIR